MRHDEVMIGLHDLDDPRAFLDDSSLNALADAIKANAGTGPIGLTGPDNPGRRLIAMATSMAPALVRDLRRARRMLNMLEWSKDDTCPECGAGRGDGHTAPCAMAAVLGRRT